jgi:hypothetical protein
MQQISDLFCSAGAESTRFLNRAVDFANCFARTTFSGTQGTAPALWDFNFGTAAPVFTTTFGGAGNSATSLTNYTNIPTRYMLIDVKPTTAWAKGDVITGQTSGQTCTIMGTYPYVNGLRYFTSTPSGAFTLGEVIGVTGNANKLADQGATKPTFDAIFI